MRLNTALALRRGIAVPALIGRVRRDSLLRNSIFIMGTTGVTALLGYGYWMIAAHMYSAHDVGLASALLGVMSLGAFLASLGIGPSFIQLLPLREAGSAWSLTLTAGLVLGASVSLLLAGIADEVLPRLSPEFAILAHRPDYAIALLVSVPIWCVATLLDQVFVAERASGNMLLRNAVFAVLKIVALALFVFVAYATAVSIFWSWIIPAGVTVIGSVLLLVPRLGRAYSPVFRGIAGQVRSMLRTLAGHHLISIGAAAPVYALPILVTARLSATDNAYFYATWQLSSLFFMVSPPVTSALYAEGTHTPDELLRKAGRSTAIISAFLAPAMLVSFVGGRLLLGLFGARYASHGILLLWILTFTAIPDAITNVYIVVLRVQRRFRSAIFLNWGMAFVALSLTWILLPMVGIAGVGWAWVSGQSTGTVFVCADLMMARRRARRARETLSAEVSPQL